eukprot:Colp12_sorted_trinity150504_noHs@23452
MFSSFGADKAQNGKQNNEEGKRESFFSKPLSIMRGKTFLSPDKPSSSENGPRFDDLMNKLEQQNNLLKQDEKAKTALAMISKNNSENASSSPSLPTSPDKKPELDNNPEDQTSHESWAQWGNVLSDWESSIKKNGKQVKTMILEGIPPSLRGLVWQLLADAYQSPFKKLYPQLLPRESPCEKLISRDIARTFPHHDFFKDHDGLGQEQLYNVIKAYSLYDPEVGYCQGEPFIVGVLLMQMPEEEAFSVLVQLMYVYNLRELFKPDMTSLHVTMYQYERLLEEMYPEVYAHLYEEGIQTSMYASQWFLTLFATFMPLDFVFHLMDVFLAEGTDFMLQVALALVGNSAQDIRTMPFEDILKYLKGPIVRKYKRTGDLVNAALEVKINKKKLAKFEKDYVTEKLRRTEEQETIKGLREENQQLMAKVLECEREQADMMERLVTAQFGQGQKEDENFKLRRELKMMTTELDKLRSEATRWEREKLQMGSDLTNIKLALARAEADRAQLASQLSALKKEREIERAARPSLNGGSAV